MFLDSTNCFILLDWPTARLWMRLKLPQQWQGLKWQWPRFRPGTLQKRTLAMWLGTTRPSRWICSRERLPKTLSRLQKFQKLQAHLKILKIMLKGWILKSMIPLLFTPGILQHRQVAREVSNPPKCNLSRNTTNWSEGPLPNQRGDETHHQVSTGTEHLPQIRLLNEDSTPRRRTEWLRYGWIIVILVAIMYSVWYNYEKLQYKSSSQSARPTVKSDVI